ncbi:hypothetical protein D1007_07518 [Hordeum vulgare]|nr:hypothetical protein D1007_07518 [Hordeum vulgare]
MTDLPQLEQLVIEKAPCLVRGSFIEALFCRFTIGSTVILGLSVDTLITVVYTVKILALEMHNLSLDTVIE